MGRTTMTLARNYANAVRRFKSTMNATTRMRKVRDLSVNYVLGSVYGKLGSLPNINKLMFALLYSRGHTIVSCGGSYDFNAETINRVPYMYVQHGRNVRFETCGSNYDTYIKLPCSNDDYHGCSGGGNSNYGSRCTVHLNEGFHKMKFERRGSSTKLNITCF